MHPWMPKACCFIPRLHKSCLLDTVWWLWFVKNHAHDSCVITLVLSMIHVMPCLPSSQLLCAASSNWFCENASCSVLFGSQKLIWYGKKSQDFGVSVHTLISFTYKVTTCTIFPTHTHTHMAFVFLFCCIYKPGIELCLWKIFLLHTHNENDPVMHR